ncbi:MAG: PspC domain-containing protein [Acidimicrobiales bacterium]
MATDTPLDDNPPPQAEPTRPIDRPVKHLVRGPGGPVGGVATGIANWFAIDPLVVQIAFVVLTIAAGSGFLLYLAGWILIPAFDRPLSHRQGTGRVILGSIGLALAILAILAIVGGSLGAPLLLLGIGFYLLSQRPGDAAAIGENVRDLLRPRGAASRTAADYSAEPPPPTAWGTPRTDGANLADVGYTSDYVPPPPNARRRASGEPGPPITTVTLALAAVVAGLLIWLDRGTGLRITGSAVCGAVLGLCGLGLVVSSFVGRAWGLLPVGILASIGMITAPALGAAFETKTIGDVRHEVTAQTDLLDTYELGVGQLTLDLTGLTLESDASVAIDVGTGSLQVLLPDDMSVDVTATASFGNLVIFGVERDGVGADYSTEYRPPNAPADVPVLEIEAHTQFGEVMIRHES